MTVIMKGNKIGLLESLIMNEKKTNWKRAEERDKKIHKTSWNNRDNFLHFTENKSKSKKEICVLNVDTAFGYH